MGASVKSVLSPRDVTRGSCSSAWEKSFAILNGNQLGDEISLRVVMFLSSTKQIADSTIVQESSQLNSTISFNHTHIP